MNDYLLPYKYKWVGAVLVFSGLVGLVFFTWFDFVLTLPVFAVFSSFFETKIFTTYWTNVSDELIMLSLLCGLFLMVFSKEKAESGILDKLRAKAFAKAILSNMCLLVLSIIFVYGKDFLAILLLNLFSAFIFYLIYFFFLKKKELKQSKGKLIERA
jgi:hypothetical protein